MNLIELVISTIAIAVIMVVPISYKWELPMKSVIIFLINLIPLIIVIMYAVLIFWKLPIIAVVLFQIFLTAVISISLLLWKFYRDPDRIICPNEKVIYSPADGRILYIKRIKEGNSILSEKKNSVYKIEDFTHTKYLNNSAYHIGIGMSFIDVHVNRSPISGKVKIINHIKGSFKSLKHQKSILENERTVMVIEGKNINIGLVQIASRLVRMIVLFVKPDQWIEAGSRIGKIRFGSQVDLILPQSDSIKILVKENDYVKAGLTRIAELT